MRIPDQPSRDLPLLIFVSAVAVILLYLFIPEEQQSAPKQGIETHYGPAFSRARSNLPALFSSDDYPVAALREEQQGMVAFTLSIDPRGLVSNCVIARSSGSASLDDATCRVLQRRARFDPARDIDGKPVADLYSGRIKWVLPDE